MSFLNHEQNGLVWFTSPVLTGVRHSFSTRKGGVSPAPWDSLNLRLDQDDGHEALVENFRRFCAVTNISIERSVLSCQVHKTTVRVCTAEDAGKGLFRERGYTADALITNEPDLPLFVFSADCGNLLLHDPVTGAVGAVHAGWRGCAAGIVEKTVQTMHSVYGSSPTDLRVALGPCIGSCCFETDRDVVDAMLTSLGPVSTACMEPHGPKWHVDLAGLNRLWLLRAGVLPEHIDVSGLCTACHPEWFWSHRKMGNARGLQCAMICRT